MPTEAAILKQIKDDLEQQGQTFEQLEGRGFSYNSNGYVLNTAGQVSKLSVYQARLTDYDFLTGLQHLTTLYLNHNHISDLAALAGLTQLIRLGLYNNQISDLTPLAGLTHLIWLDLDNNQISDLTPLAALIHLTYLDLANNQISDLTPLAMLLKSCEAFGLSGNPLEIPPLEIAKQGKQAILTWFESQKDEKLPLNEVKVLLVGDGGAGKTSLVKQLFEERFDQHESQTHGINIRHRKIKSGKNTIKVHFWDFGGQEIMHATHQFFLSKRSLYILALDGRKDDKTEYWLKHIESFGGDSPVLVALNKIDEQPGFEVNRRFLQEKYPHIQGFYRISCATGAGLPEFAQCLTQTLTQVELLRITWAKSWFTVKTQLEKLTEHFINYDRYQAICARARVTEPIAQETLVGFLHDLGVILHFKELELLDTHVLDPKWATEAVYRIINAEQLATCKGVLRLGLLEKILQQRNDTDYVYPRDKYRYIVELMKKFELCYDLDHQTVLLPDLLEVQEPAFAHDYAASLKFRLQYDFLPRSIMPRFIVKRHHDIKNDLRWRTGVVLQDADSGATAVVKADNDAKTIALWVNGERQREYFAILRNTLREIHQSFEKLDVTELVPLPDHPEMTVEYQELIGLERMGEMQIPIGKLGKKYRVKDLLDGIERAEERELQDLVDEKLHRLKKARIVETDEARKIQLEHQMKEMEDG